MRPRGPDVESGLAAANVAVANVSLFGGWRYARLELGLWLHFEDRALDRSAIDTALGAARVRREGAWFRPGRRMRARVDAGRLQDDVGVRECGTGRKQQRAECKSNESFHRSSG